MNQEYFEQLGRLVGPLPEKLAVFRCESCNEFWYGHEEIAPDGRHPRPDRYCPHCGGDQVRELPDFPGALVVKSWVDWPEECPSMETDESPSEAEAEATGTDGTAGRRPPRP